MTPQSDRHPDSPLFRIGQYLQVMDAFKPQYPNMPPAWFGRVVFANKTRCDDQWWYHLEDPSDPIEPEVRDTADYVDRCLRLPERVLESCTPPAEGDKEPVSILLGFAHDSALPYRPWFDTPTDGDLVGDVLSRWRHMKFHKLPFSDETKFPS